MFFFLIAKLYFAAKAIGILSVSACLVVQFGALQNIFTKSHQYDNSDMV